MNKNELIKQMDQQKARHIPMETMSLAKEVKRIYGS
jgi:hypothetical protein